MQAQAPTSFLLTFLLTLLLAATTTAAPVAATGQNRGTWSRVQNAVQNAAAAAPAAATATSKAASPYKTNPSTLSTARCSAGFLGTPTYGTSNINFTICAEREINAPIDKVHTTLLDFSHYRDWNSFVINVTALDGSAPPSGPAPNGWEMIFTTVGVMEGQETTSDQIVSIDEPGDGTWAMSGWKDVGQKAEHPNVLTSLGNGKTRYVSYVTYHDLVEPIDESIKEAWKRQFEAQADDLKGYVEG